MRMRCKERNVDMKLTNLPKKKGKKSTSTPGCEITGNNAVIIRRCGKPPQAVKKPRGMKEGWVS